MQGIFKDSGGDDLAQEISTLGKEGLKSLLDSADTFIFDCDGVIWFVNDVLPESPKLISLLRKLGKKVCFITNNTVHSHEEFLQRLRKGGIDVEKDEFIFPVLSMCQYLQDVQFKGKIEYLGEPAAKREVKLQGFDVVDKLAPTAKDGKGFVNATLVQEPIAAAVVDLDMNWNLIKVSRIIDILKSNPDCLYFGNCVDKLLPLAPTLIVPGPGYILNMVKDITGKEPKIFGKPSSEMFQVLKRRFSLDPKRTIIVGDSIDSDISMAKTCGARSILVLTGSTKREHIPYNDPLKRPSYISEGVAELLSLIVS